ncbi:MAG: PepSY domain-containing protein [Colwellia sp.]|nr:PepSY domain-containing protein [Colwellia sp.]
MSLLKTSRKYHKWLMLFLGVQFVIWSVTGAYMVFFDIDYIHGDSLIENHQTKIDSNKIDFSLKQLLIRYPDAEKIELGIFINQEVYRFNQEDEKFLVTASNGKQLSPLTESEAIAAAKHLYTGSGEVRDTELITDNPPFELSRRVYSSLPAWRINFDNFGSPSLYISITSGKLLAKRHEFWRLFDWMFNFHMMDYSDGEIDNWLLFWFTLFSIVAAVMGLILTYFRVFKKETIAAVSQDNVQGGSV